MAKRRKKKDDKFNFPTHKNLTINIYRSKKKVCKKIILKQTHWSSINHACSFIC